MLVASTRCKHCGDPVPERSDGGPDFCCSGCAGAFELVQGLGLGTYYERRTIDPETRALRPEDDDLKIDYASHVLRDEVKGLETLYLMVEGIHCAACVWLIETVLGRTDGVDSARVNMTTRRLVITWKSGAADPNDLVAGIAALGYRLVPYDPALLGSENRKREKELLRSMAVAGFAAGNVMLFSVSIWAGHAQDMQASTRDLMHWLSALVALPAVAFAGLPFYRSALTALKAGRTNMDVPISLAVLLAAGMSLIETLRGSEHAYFDSAVMLLFFLLIGRFLDHRARGRARGAAEQLLGLNATAVTVLEDDGSRRMVRPEDVTAGQTVLAAAGERISIDGNVLSGEGDVDTSLLTGESVPAVVRPGDAVFAGTLSLNAPLQITVTATGEGTLLSEIVRLMEDSEQGRAKYVALADRAARGYAPLVHFLALATFIGWFFWVGAIWQDSLLVAVSVLIITCPCALALAVPVVQVIASGRLLRKGVLVKSATALERFATIDTIVFDKTGTLTTGKAVPDNLKALKPDDRDLAASLAGASKHPLARAYVRAVPGVFVAQGVQELPGKGLQWGEVRLGSREWCGDASAPEPTGPEMWLSRPAEPPVRISFQDPLRKDAAEVVARLKARGLKLKLLSGDRETVVRELADKVGIADWQAECQPADKVAALKTLGDHTLMVGDGLNDAPALAAAHASLSPSTAADVSQTTADAVFQGERLVPVLDCLETAKRADRLVKQNFQFSFLYNIITVPLGVMGFITPLIAAVAMSSSSIVVILNALRLAKR